MRSAAIVHVYYAERWRELAACLRAIGECDLWVTFSDEASIAEARRDFPKATFIRCENRGYDVWPFLRALQTIELSHYDIVIKLHTKRDVLSPFREVVGYTRLNGARWREHLLRFASTPENCKRR